MIEFAIVVLLRELFVVVLVAFLPDDHHVLASHTHDRVKVRGTVDDFGRLAQTIVVHGDLLERLLQLDRVLVRYLELHDSSFAHFLQIELELVEETPFGRLDHVVALAILSRYRSQLVISRDNSSNRATLSEFTFKKEHSRVWHAQLVGNVEYLLHHEAYSLLRRGSIGKVLDFEQVDGVCVQDISH